MAGVPAPKTATVSADKSFLVESWSVRDGLPAGAIESLLGLRDGYLVVAREGGVSVFDGTSFRSPRDLTGIEPDSAIRSLFEDADGVVWTSTTRSSVLRWRGRGLSKALALTANSVSSNVAAVCQASDKVFWLATTNGLVRLIGKNEGTFAVTAFEGSTLFSSVVCAKDGSQWATVEGGGLAQFRQGVRQRFADEVANVSQHASIVVEDPSGDLWLGTTDGVVARMSKGKVVFSDSTLLGHEVTGLLLDKSQRLWTTARGVGLALLEKDRLQPLSAAAVPSLVSASAITEDSHGNVWVGTATSLVRLRPRPFAKLADEVPGVALRSVVALPDGTLWVGSDTSGAFEIKNGKVTKVLDLSNGFGGNSVRSMAVGAPGELYFATDTGLSLLSSKGMTNWGKQDGISSDGIAFAMRASNGDLWLRGGGRGVVRMNQQGVRRFAKDSGLGSWGNISILSDHTGQLWAATEGVLFKFDGERFVQAVVMDSKRRSAVFCLVEIDKVMWVGTTRGLVRIDGSAAKEFGADKGIDGAVVAIVDDLKGNLWLRTHDGIVVFPKEAGTSTQLPFLRTFNSEDGVAAVDLNRVGAPMAARDGQGKLWFVDGAGLLIADPALLAPTRATPTVSIDELTSQGKLLESDFKQDVVLPLGLKTFSIEFSSPSLSEPRKTSFKYSMRLLMGHLFGGDAKDSVFVQTVAPSAAFFDLSPGRYQFEVMARNAEGVWSSQPARVNVVILPRFWQRRAVQGGAALLACLALVALVVGLRERELRSKHRSQLEERNRIARELHDSLEQGLAAVTLTLRAGNEHAADPVRVTKTLDDARAMLRHVQTDVRHFVWDLRGHPLANPDLRSALTALAAQLRQTGALTVDLEIQGEFSELSSEARSNIMRVAQEATTNVLKHAKATQIKLSLSRQANHLSLVVCDNGVGMKGHTAAQASGHYGLRGMQERAKTMNAELSVTSENAVGTTVTLTLPLNPDLGGET
jgi:signal transduction histidine kinase/ligand-binding sensor domain-containing protein